MSKCKCKCNCTSQEILQPDPNSTYEVVPHFSGDPYWDTYYAYDEEGFCWICNHDGFGRDGCKGHTRESAEARYGTDLTRFIRANFKMENSHGL